jgi:hypothetical protein
MHFFFKMVYYIRMTTRQSQFNNTGLPLIVGGTFTGIFERTLTGLEISTFVNCSGLCLVTIEQSVDATNVRITTTFNYDPVNDVSTFSVPVALPFFRVRIFNGDIVAQSFLTLNTYIINTPPQQVVVAGGTVAIAGTVDVDATNLITETLATRRVDFLVAGDWYRVASVGLTTGAEWQVISGGTACVGGQSIPDIGRLFKCVVAGPAVAGGGECYDVEYTDTVSATVTNLITETLATRRVDFLVVGDYYRVASVGLTSGAEWQVISGGTACVGGQSVPDIGRLFKCVAAGPAVAGGGTCYDVEYTDDVSATITNFPATQAVTGTVSLTDPTTVRVRDTYGDPIVTTAGNLMVGIGNIYTANPLHVIVDSVTLPTTSVAGALAVSTTGITLKATAGKLLTLHINSDGALGTNYVKIYNVAVPTSADTPIFTIGVLFGSSQNVDCSSLNFATAIGVRATNAAAAGDNTPPTNTVNVTAFFV